MKILRNAGLISALGLSATLNAAVEFSDGLVPAELARVFIGGTIYRSLPDNFPVPALPPGLDLQVVGSLEQGSNQQVVLHSGRASEAVFADLREAYQAEGWVDLSLQASRLALCHDQLGSLQVLVSTTGPDASHIRAIRSILPSGLGPLPGSLTCAQQRAMIEEAANEAAPSTWFFQLMPVLELPADAEPASQFSPGLIGRFVSVSSSGSGFEMDNDGGFSLADTTMAELQEHFALQLEEQGWTGDSSGLGDTSASSVWYRTVQPPVATGGTAAPDLPLTGIMTLLSTGDDNYRMLFKLQGGEGVPRPSLGIRGIPIGVDSFVRDPL